MSGTTINLNFTLSELFRTECVYSFVAMLTFVAHAMSLSLEGQLRNALGVGCVRICESGAIEKLRPQPRGNKTHISRTTDS